MLITVFTPTYNRAYLLTRLHESLVAQSSKNFEWLIVDDGSTDNTGELILSLQADFPIRYIRQANAGKHIAINRGAQLAKGDLFFVVDSDDYLPPTCVATIIDLWEPLSDKPDFAGVCLNKSTPEGEPLGNPSYTQLDCSPVEFRYKHHEKGDKAEVIRTDLFLRFPFPETKDEKFCPEALFFNRLKDYKIRYMNKNGYYCEYLPDGLSAKIISIRKKSPYNTCTYYLELSKLNIPFIQQLKAITNFYRFRRYTKKTLEKPSSNMFLNYIARTLAAMLYFVKDMSK